MSVYKLALYPVLPDDQSITAEQSTELIDTLREWQFLSDQEMRVDGLPRFLLGQACMTQLTFLGCSPHIELDPPVDSPEEAARQGKFCHLTITRFDAPRWRVDPTARPRCPVCRKSVRQQEMLITDELVCPHCGEHSQASDWQWRSLGARAHFFLDIWGVFTSEAVPNPPLLDALRSVTETEWRYFYVKD